MGMTVTEALMEGLKTTVVGLSIVFGVLIILMLVLMLMKVVFYKEPKKAQATVKKEEAPVAASAPAPVSTQADDSELIAVLTAAIAASLNTSTYNLRIKSFRRVDSKANAWNNASIRENMNNKTY